MFSTTSQTPWPQWTAPAATATAAAAAAAAAAATTAVLTASTGTTALQPQPREEEQHQFLAAFLGTFQLAHLASSFRSLGLRLEGDASMLMIP
jgi:hypothetical protein